MTGTHAFDSDPPDQLPDPFGCLFEVVMLPDSSGRVDSREGWCGNTGGGSIGEPVAVGSGYQISVQTGRLGMSNSAEFLWTTTGTEAPALNCSASARAFFS